MSLDPPCAWWVSHQSLRNWIKQTQLDLHERDDGLTADEREELRPRGVRSMSLGM
jgi:hypothetical protein